MFNRLPSLLILISRCSSAFLRAVEDALKSAVDAGKDRSDAADTALLQQKKRWTGTPHGIIQNNSESPFMSIAPSGDAYIS
jgi:hypothetical protein